MTNHTNTTNNTMTTTQICENCGRVNSCVHEGVVSPDCLDGCCRKWERAEKNEGIKIFSYTALMYRYYCECNRLKPTELKSPEDVCPRCGRKVDSFREAGL